MGASYVSVIPKIPEAWTKSEKGRAFFAGLAGASRSQLLLDYDGTLAPFVEDRLHAVMYLGVRDRLVRLLTLQGSRPAASVAFVSGRKAHELQSLLSIGFPVEIWGSHGREHLAADGSYTVEPLTKYEQRGLDALGSALEREYDPAMLEWKPNSVAVHWRGVESRQDDIANTMTQLFSQFANNGQDGRLELLPFDGGIELRAGQLNKGHAVERILADLPDDRFAAFLGDDLTDEDAFRVLRSRGEENRNLAVLVRGEARESYAQLWLKPPKELLQFLDGWIEAIELGAEAAS
jgi:trehalose-phosphatase